MTTKEDLSKQSASGKLLLTQHWIFILQTGKKKKSNYKSVVLKSPCISRAPWRNTAQVQGEIILFSLPQLKVKFAWEQPDAGIWQAWPSRGKHQQGVSSTELQGLTQAGSETRAPTAFQDERFEHRHAWVSKGYRNE